ncbi:hypothetical protein KP509_08G012800 [Ceratopteris richardii]|uniref:NB-ARC domain-containing protein n=1 Tax=Ceratopteris richardii TaxID=49495 RepID=A0A8T2U5Z0_CERRI|nr:hypothetical protein KP509_08G012800 [Ceratopteris richardii]
MKCKKTVLMRNGNGGLVPCTTSLFCMGANTSPAQRRFQWGELYDIVKIVEASAQKISALNHGSKYETLYLQKINEVLKDLELQEKSEHVFLVGLYGRKKSELSNLLVEILGRTFHRVCKLSNIMEKAYQLDGISNIVRQTLSDLIQLGTSNDVRRCQLLLENERCLVVLDDLGNDIDKIKKLLEELKSILRNRSLVVVASQFQHTLQELNVHKIINLSSLDNKRDSLHICYTKRDGINDAFLSNLSETFDMLGLSVRLLNEDNLMSDSTCLRDAKVIICIISKSLSIGEFKSMCTNAAIPPKNIVYVSYGSNPTDESMPKPFFKLEVDFEKAKLNRPQFKSMVNEVVQALNERREEIMGAIDFPVGLAQRSTDIGCSILDCVSRSEHSVQCFGLVGMGGVGKTTLAMSIFNKIHSKFERSFFSLNTRSEVQGKGVSGLVDLQKKIMAKLLNQTADVRIDNVHNGKMVLSSRLKNINALIVLDDVDDVGQLDALCEPLQSCLGPKSVVIITTRDRRLIKSAQSMTTFDIEGLDKEMSKWLFYWHAFMKPKPPADLEEVSQMVVEACNGLPLSLKVLGSHLSTNFDRKYWEESLIYLHETNNDIFKALRISFEGLDNAQKEAFLDVCCFLIGKREDLACMVLEAIYKTGRTILEVLKDRCLITITTHYFGTVKLIGMHDQLRDMGRHIIRQERRDRAWDEETANEILQHENARSSLRGLSVWGDIPFTEEASDCRHLPQLRILVVKEPWPEGTYSDAERAALYPHVIFRNVRCGELRWLQWESAPFEELPQGLCSTKIQVLELPESEISEVPTACLPNLQHLDLTACEKLKGFDLGIGTLTALRNLHLAHCSLLDSVYKDTTSVFLTSLPTTLRVICFSMDIEPEYGSMKGVEDASLPNLRHLSISCSQLKRLALHMTSLEILDMRGSYGLEDMDCKGLSSLQVLTLDYCKFLATLSSLPTTLRSLSLRMDFDDDSDEDEYEDGRLKQNGSPESVEDAWLPNLTDLSITGSTKLKRLALRATSLERLDLRRCGELEDLDCKGLSSLQILILDACKSLASLSSLPTTLRKLSLNMSLHIESEYGSQDESGSLESVEEASLPDLRDLIVTRCPKLKRLSLLATSLERLDLRECEGLEDLDCKGLSSLQVLTLDGCTSLVTLFSLPTTLRTLSLEMPNDVGSLETVEEVWLPNLRDLTINWCFDLKRLALHAPSLEILDLTGCGELEDFDFNGVPSLQVLILDDCVSVATLSSLPTTLRTLSFSCMMDIGSLESVEAASLPNLRDLTITDCPKLKKLALHATSMERMELRECEGFEDLDCNGLSSLEVLTLHGCCALTTLPFLPRTLRILNASLPSLTDLSITSHHKLKTFSLHATSLQRLDLSGCEGLEDLNCQGLSSLEALILDNCITLVTLSSLPTNLRKLSLDMWLRCGSLESVEDSSLPKLADLSIRRCPKLKRLALHATSLERLDFRGCEGLEYLDCTGLLSLEALILDDCMSVATLSSLPTSLRKLSLEIGFRYGSLETVEDASLPNLRELTITRCPKLKRLPLHATSLERLVFRGCEGLEYLDCTGFSSLEALILHDCISLATLSSLPTTLRKLSLEMWFTNCALEIVEDASLPNLTDLSISRCPKLKRLALHATSLERLDLRGCQGLKYLDCTASQSKCDSKCVLGFECNATKSLKSECWMYSFFATTESVKKRVTFDFHVSSPLLEYFSIHLPPATCSTECRSIQLNLEDTIYH